MKKHKTKVKWMPQPEDATNLATIRWYAIEIEKLLIEMYSTNRKKWPGLQQLLNKDMKELYDYFRKQEGPGLADEDDCPPGQQLCSDGLCAAQCMIYD